MGFGELLVILIVALLVIGPKQLPTIVKSLSQLFAQCRHIGTEIKQELDLELKKEQLKINTERAKAAEDKTTESKRESCV